MITPMENIYLICFLLLVNAVCAGFDLRLHKIPNLLTFPAMLTALGYYTVVYGLDGFYFSAAGILTGLALLILPFVLGGMGAGDAKLMGVVGACLGTQSTIKAFIFIVVIGCLYAGIVMVTQRHRLTGYFKQLWLTAQTFMLTRQYVPVEPEAVARTRPRVYYGIAIAAGTLLYVSMNIIGSHPLV